MQRTTNDLLGAELTFRMEQRPTRPAEWASRNCPSTLVRSFATVKWTGYLLRPPSQSMPERIRLDFRCSLPSIPYSISF